MSRHDPPPTAAAAASFEAVAASMAAGDPAIADRHIDQAIDHALQTHAFADAVFWQRVKLCTTLMRAGTRKRRHHNHSEENDDMLTQAIPKLDDGSDALAAGPHRRDDERYQTVLLIGRATAGARTAPCLVRNISHGGLMAHFTAPVTIGERLRLKVRGLAEVEATVRWVDGRRGGVAFDRPHDIAAVFQAKDEDGRHIRAPRFPVALAATLHLGDRRVAVDILDISAGGAKLRCAEPPQRGIAGRLAVACHPDVTVFGKVCWTRPDALGFQFVAPLPLGTLGELLDC